MDEALTNLAAIDERKSQVVELRFLGGFSIEETAEALGVSEDTVKRDWKFAKHWLLAAKRSDARNKARKSYQDFLELWRNADSGIPGLNQAEAEFASLK